MQSVEDNANSTIYRYFQWEPNTASAGQPDEDQLEALGRQGVSWVINLGLVDADYALADEAGVVGRLGMHYRHIPVQWALPCYADYVAFAAAMAASEGRKRFVHCAANCRASVFVGLYFHLSHAYAFADVLTNIQSIWQPNAVWWRMIETVLRHQGVPQNRLGPTAHDSFT